jgi:cyclomaltodextrinase
MRKLVAGLLLALVCAAPVAGTGKESGMMKRAPREVYEARMADWRNRQVVYQVFVDRFAAGRDPREKRALYEAPRRLRAWSDQPVKGTFLEDARVWSHEVDFWGGDLAGLTSRLDYIQSLGANTVYLNPIFLAYTNHKYDATDYFQIDPQYGTEADFERLCDEAHRRGMRVVLDGVFNHTGRRGVWFQEASRDEASPLRDYYYFDKKYPNGYRGWINIANLPELNYENPAVRDVVYRSPDSAVQRWLEHADGWRLDVAFELGPEVLLELTESAHRARPDSFTVGEIYNYPTGWFPALDGVMNMYVTNQLLAMTQGKLSGPRCSETIDTLVRDAGIEPLLRSWLVITNHDRHRLKSTLPAYEDRAFILALQATLPGAPLVYYGEELGFTGKEDPEMRGPMDWDLARSGKPPELALTRTLLGVRNAHRALQVGDFMRVPTDRLFAFVRYTDTVRDTVLVVANPTAGEVTEIVSTGDSWLMDNNPMRDVLTGSRVSISAGLLTVTVPPKSVRVLVPVVDDSGVYSPYKRVP